MGYRREDSRSGSYEGSRGRGQSSEGPPLINTGRRVPKDYWDIPKDQVERKRRFLAERFGPGARAKKVESEYEGEGGWFIFAPEGSAIRQAEHTSFSGPSARKNPDQLVLDLSSLSVGEEVEIMVSIKKVGGPPSEETREVSVVGSDDITREPWDASEDDDIPY